MLVAIACLEKVMIAGEVGSRGNANGTGRNDMKRFFESFALAVVVALVGWALLAPAKAAPPTVTPSPGYDARLQEQRAARAVYEPAVPHAKPVGRRHVRRIHHGAY
jgi:hypothetical protein